MKKLLKEYDFNSDMDYFEMIVESFINGQYTQAIDQFKALPKKERKAMVCAAMSTWKSNLTEKQICTLTENI